MRYVIGMGANLGDRLGQMQRAVALLEAARVRVERASPVYESEPVGPPQPCYLNAAIRVDSERTPPALLALLHEVEARLGRVREVRWGARTIDLDILWCERPWPQPRDGSATPASALSADRGPSLEIPHPRLRERWFALRPLLDVAPELEPCYGETLERLCGNAARAAPEAVPRPLRNAHILAISREIPEG